MATHAERPRRVNPGDGAMSSPETQGGRSAKARVRNSYLATISLLGLVLVVWGAVQLPKIRDPFIFLMLLALAVAAQLTATAVIGGEVTVEVGTAISLAAVPLFGTAPAALVAAAAQTGLSLLSIRVDRPSWQRVVERVAFNSGMASAAIFLAGSSFVIVEEWLGADTLLGQTIPWLAAALIADQINLWLLIGLIHWQHAVPPLAVWREHGWAIPINVLVMAVGGGVLALAVWQFAFLGVAIFFLPIFLSAYAFRLYIGRTQEEMVKLEELVELRTGALIKANEELAELHKEKDAFLAVLTHDMRTPLTSIHGYACLLRDHPELPSEQRAHMTEVILRNEKALLDMVNNILAIQQLQSGIPILLERENLDLSEVIRNVTETLQQQAQEKHIRLKLDLAPERLFINADRRKLSRVIQNLIANAIKYTPNVGQITVEASLNGRQAVIEVADNGLGIPPDELPFIFERFRRVRKHQDSAVGTGLGLAIVKSLVEAHDGQVSVVSQEGMGSRFTVELPA